MVSSWFLVILLSLNYIGNKCASSSEEMSDRLQLYKIKCKIDNYFVDKIRCYYFQSYKLSKLCIQIYKVEDVTS